MTIIDGVALFFVLVSGALMGLMDRSAHGKLGRPPSTTWKNKYKKDATGELIPTKNRRHHWWYFGLFRPVYVERFPFSTTWLVWLSDHWHLYKKLFMLAGWIVLTLRPTPTKWMISDGLLYAAVFLLSFNLFYHWKQIRPQNKQT